jgi:hypothetical protein
LNPALRLNEPLASALGDLLAVRDSAALTLSHREGRGDVMEVQPRNPTAKGPAEWFTGEVWTDAIAQAHGPSL